MSTVKYAIAVTISEAEHDGDRWDYIVQLFRGEREWLSDEDGEPLTVESILTRPVGDLFQWADDEMGEEYDHLWLYPGGAEGLDPDPRWLFDTREEAEATAETCRIAGTSLYEVMEVQA